MWYGHINKFSQIYLVLILHVSLTSIYCQSDLDLWLSIMFRYKFFKLHVYNFYQFTFLCCLPRRANRDCCLECYIIVHVCGHTSVNPQLFLKHVLIAVIQTNIFPSPTCEPSILFFLKLIFLMFPQSHLS